MATLYMHRYFLCYPLIVPTYIPMYELICKPIVEVLIFLLNRLELLFSCQTFIHTILNASALCMVRT